MEGEQKGKYESFSRDLMLMNGLVSEHCCNSEFHGFNVESQ